MLIRQIVEQHETMHIITATGDTHHNIGIKSTIHLQSATIMWVCRLLVCSSDGTVCTFPMNDWWTRIRMPRLTSIPGQYNSRILQSISIFVDIRSRFWRSASLSMTMGRRGISGDAISLCRLLRKILSRWQISTSCRQLQPIARNDVFGVNGIIVIQQCCP